MEITHNQTLLSTKKNTTNYIIKITFPYHVIYNKINEHNQLKQSKKLLIQEINKLYKENIHLTQEKQKLKILEQENIMLRNLLNIQIDTSIKKITVNILNRIWNAAGPIIVAQNAKQIRVGYLAIVENGLLGRVEKIIDNKIFIIPITNKNFRTPIVLGNNMEHALIIGDKKPTIKYFEDNSEIKENDEVFALDNNGNIIKNIKIGSVKIINNKHFLHSNINIKKYRFATILISEN